MASRVPFLAQQRWEAKNLIVYLHGEDAYSITDYRQWSVIESGGIFILGQEFDGYGSNFEQWQALQGKISQVIKQSKSLFTLSQNELL